jgi:type I restriction enzyme R subunit
MCHEEGLMTDELQKLIDNYLYSGRKPRGDDIVNALKERPKLLELTSTVGRITKRLTDFITTFIEGV